MVDVLRNVAATGARAGTGTGSLAQADARLTRVLVSGPAGVVLDDRSRDAGSGALGTRRGRAGYLTGDRGTAGARGRNARHPGGRSREPAGDIATRNARHGGRQSGNGIADQSARSARHRGRRNSGGIGDG